MLKAARKARRVKVCRMKNSNSLTLTRAHFIKRRCHAVARVQGFAYLWTLMLVAFMGVALVIASEIYATTLQREKERELIFIGHQFREAIGRYYESNTAGGQHQYPMTLDDLLKDPRSPNAQRHLRRIYTDPMMDKATWGTILVNGRIAGIHSLSDKVPIKQDNFDVTEAGFRGKNKYSEWTFTYPPDLLLPTMKNGTGVNDAVDNMSQKSK